MSHSSYSTQYLIRAIFRPQLKSTVVHYSNINMATERNDSSLRAPAHITSLLDRLHTLSTAQEPVVNDGLKEARQIRVKDPIAGSRELDRLMLDKFIALDQDKCEFVYQLILATGATNVVEAGTSFGVSTIYLALGVGENSPTLGKVIATEKESEKAARAREHWKEAGDLVLNHVELREGDLLETLQKDLPMIDMLLLDSSSIPLHITTWQF